MSRAQIDALVALAADAIYVGLVRDAYVPLGFDLEGGVNVETVYRKFANERARNIVQAFAAEVDLAAETAGAA